MDKSIHDQSVVMFIGNKCDRNDRAVLAHEVQDYARSSGHLFVETTAKLYLSEKELTPSMQDVDVVFGMLTSTVLDKVRFHIPIAHDTVNPFQDEAIDDSVYPQTKKKFCIII